MAQKSFEQMVQQVAAAVDDFESLIKADPKILEIYSSAMPFQEKVDAAIGYWRSRPDYWINEK